MDAEFAVPQSDDNPVVGLNVIRVEFLPQSHEAQIDVALLRSSGAVARVQSCRITDKEKYGTVLSAICFEDALQRLIVALAGSGEIPALKPAE